MTDRSSAINDSDLTASLQNPEECRAAFGEVIRRYSEPLYLSRYDAWWRIMMTPMICFQNTFLKAWSSIDAFRGQAKLSTWLYKIAINESLTFLEKERKRLNISIDDESSMLINAIEADTHTDGDETLKKLRQAIATLPEKQRIVFNMRYYDEIPYEQMSEILGTSAGALKASYHHAVKK